MFLNLDNIFFTCNYLLSSVGGMKKYGSRQYWLSSDAGMKKYSVKNYWLPSAVLMK